MSDDLCKLCGDAWRQPKFNSVKMMEPDGTLKDLDTSFFDKLFPNSLVKTTWEGEECLICTNCGLDAYPVSSDW